MSGYTVKIAELGKLIGDLETGAGRMADANKKLSGGGAWGALGDEGLAKSGMDFEEAWEFGIGRLGEAAEGVTERLKKAQQKYQKMEEEFGGDLDKFAELIPDGSGPSPRFPLGDDGGGPVGGGYTGGITDILGGGR
ncbi:hypothetical protein ACFORH_05730 [Amycolatopsis roodepoortensis]|uniref:WXG100 family type VII secretion target n=1 Tax=Amycolatopsis roodepoortensis TaxID=700274 RepID=A0ABR9L727_9PSEU|nr:hypothetical protein [Amycolatopsis roodepoortensis]MBE1576509.1 hypothetical protein [Amycolatopsis roodepoortensis]